MSRIRKMYLSMMGLSYRTQVELVKELREKDEDFIDSALKVRPNNLYPITHTACSHNYGESCGECGEYGEWVSWERNSLLIEALHMLRPVFLAVKSIYVASVFRRKAQHMSSR